jgi:hypothetical protein
MTTHDPHDDERWLDNIQKEQPTDSETSRVGSALRKRHYLHQSGPLATDADKHRLQNRLIAEGLLDPPLRKDPIRWLTSWLQPLITHRKLLAGAVSILLIIGVTGRFIPSLSQKAPIGQSSPLSETEITRGNDSALIALFPGEAIAGFQYQIVDDVELAVAAWRAALIEAGIEHQVIRRATEPQTIELHLQLSPSAAHLQPRFALKNAPDHGEWVVILLPKSP